MKKKAEGLSMQTIVVAIIVIIVLVVIIAIFVSNMGKTNDKFKDFNNLDFQKATCVAKGNCKKPIPMYNNICGANKEVCDSDEVCCLEINYEKIKEQVGGLI